MIAYFLVALVAYLIGSINFSVIFSKKLAGFDVREKGSGNAGTTNMLRTVGVKAAIITLICDILKGVVAIGFAYIINRIISVDLHVNGALLIQIAGIMVILGHTFPVFFKFKGGKGVATSLGVLIMTNWQIGLICLVFAIVLIGLTRMVSVGSLAAAILFPVLTILGGKISENFIVTSDGSIFSYFIYSVILAVLVIFNHRENIKRLTNGTESRISFKKEK